MRFQKAILCLGAVLILAKTDFIFEFIKTTLSEWRGDLKFDMWAYGYHDYSGLALALGIAAVVLCVVDRMVPSRVAKVVATISGLVVAGWIAS